MFRFSEAFQHKCGQHHHWNLNFSHLILLLIGNETLYKPFIEQFSVKLQWNLAKSVNTV